jgi:phage shock protein E
MMIYLMIAIVGILALYNFFVLRTLRKRIEDVKDSIQNHVSWAKEDLRGDIQGVRTVIKVLASGGRVTPDMIEEGKPYSDISAVEAAKMLEEKPETIVIDVRSPSEFQEGHIPGARLIPVDEIEYRMREIPKEAPALLVTCQGGSRSAAACQFLSERGYTNLINMYDGMGSWPAKKEIGPTIRPPAQTVKNA